LPAQKVGRGLEYCENVSKERQRLRRQAAAFCSYESDRCVILIIELCKLVMSTNDCVAGGTAGMMEALVCHPLGAASSTI